MNIWGLPGETSTSANRRLFLKNTEITSSSKSHASDAKWQKNSRVLRMSSRGQNMKLPDHQIHTTHFKFNKTM